ncbi:MAG: glycoside hydrolase family 16 protein [Oscillospiraceae bacterium]|nr:glycoside hydrolase family 16 protein [Oscillospiraceae bacterium]
MDSSVIAFITALMTLTHGTEIPDKGFFTADDGTLYIDGQAYHMTFDDEFDGNELDPSKWERCPQQHRQDMDNYWDDSMSYVDGGCLIIAIDKTGERYISGGVRTKGRFEQAYGYYEICCSVNTIPGYWTAFWLHNDSVANESGGGRNGTEIDIYESPYCEQKQIQHTLHWDGYGAAHRSEGKTVDADVYDGKFHTFGLLWTEEEYVFYIDGRESWRTDAKAAQGTCEVPLYIKVTAETGSWVDIPDEERLPDSMKADYVRVYARGK